MSEIKQYKFKGVIIKCTYNTPDYKIYAVDVNKKDYPDIKQNKYGNVSILGELSDLTLGVEYEITAEEQTNKYGASYKVINIKRDIPTTIEGTYLFLSEILTENQAKVLIEHYPNIIQKVKDNDLEDIDLSKLKGIGEKIFEVIKDKIITNFALMDLVIEFKNVLSMSIIKKIYDRYSSIDKLKEKLKTEPYTTLTRISGIGFKTADSIILQLQKESIIDFGYDVKTSPDRCLSCILYILEENENEGHTKMNLADLRQQCLKIVPACAEHFVDVIKDETIYYNKETMDVSLRTTYETEKYIADTILANVHNANNVWNYDVEKYKTVNGVTLSDEQMKIVENICKYNINILNGAAGCVDCDTEYFNGTKWKKISNYVQGEKVLQYNNDGTANLVNPLAYIKNKSDYLWEFSGRYGIDQCLSDNHNVVYTTKSLYNKNNKVKFIKFSDLKTMHESGQRFYGKFITTFDYVGNGINISDDELRLMVAIISDGCFRKDNRYHNCLINVKKDRKKQRIEYLLQQNNIEYDTYISDKKSHEGYTTYRFHYDKLESKKYPKYFYQCNKHQFQIIFDEIFNWDGNFDGYKQWCSSDKDNVDFIQFVGAVLGYKSSITKYDRENSYIDGREIMRNKSTYTVYFAERTLLGLNNDIRTPDKWTKFNKYPTKDGYEYCFTVPSHMLVLRRNDNIFVTGNCGKSFSTQAIINMLKEHNKSFKLFSPTGRAAKVLHDFTNENTSTIHRGLGWTPNGFTFNKDNQLKCDVIVVDEFGMVDIWLFKSLLKAIDFNTTKLLLIGDNAQLMSVGCGNLLHDFMESDIIPTVTLSKVFRYGEGGLMRVATDTRCCKEYLTKDMKTKATTFGDNQDYMFIDLPSESIPKNVVALYKKLLDNGSSIEDIQVLTAKNVGDCGSVILNNMIQRVANPNYGSEINMKVGDTTYYEGDLILQTVNNYDAELDIRVDPFENDFSEFDFENKPKTAFVANGETAIIKEICNTYVIADFNGIRVKYYRNDMNMVKLGYAISIHKSQGGGFKKVILCTPQSHIFMLNSNLLYVGLTRMKEKLYHLGSLQSVNQAVKKKANLTRHTFMQNLLKNTIDN